MKRDQHRESANDRSASQVADEAENDDPEETDWHALEVSANHYERRWRIRIKSHHRDWWIAVALYSLLISIAIVAL